MDDKYHLIYQKIAKSQNCINDEAAPYKFPWVVMGEHVEATVTNRREIVQALNPPPLLVAGVKYPDRIGFEPINLRLHTYNDPLHRIPVTSAILFGKLIREFTKYTNEVRKCPGVPDYRELSKDLTVKLYGHQFLIQSVDQMDFGTEHEVVYLDISIMPYARNTHGSIVA